MIAEVLLLITRGMFVETTKKVKILRRKAARRDSQDTVGTAPSVLLPLSAISSVLKIPPPRVYFKTLSIVKYYKILKGKKEKKRKRLNLLE